MELLGESLKLGIMPALVVAGYLIITKFIDHKEKNRTVAVNKEIIDCFTKLNSFLDYFTKDIIEKETDKRDVGIKNAFKSFANSIIKTGTYTIISNNIEVNKPFIIDNVNHLINTEYTTLHSTLVLYDSAKIRISKYINPIWRDELIKLVLDIIYNSNSTKEDKLYNMNSRCNARINDYCSEILNNILKHEQSIS